MIMLYNLRMNRLFSVLLFACVGWAHNPLPQTVIFPFDGNASSDHEWLGLGLTLAIHAQEAPRVVPFSLVREVYEQQGYRISDPVPLASKMEMARLTGAEILVFGSVSESQIQVYRIHIPTQITDHFEIDLQAGDLGEAAGTLTKHLGIDGMVFPVLNEFYRVWATCYLIEEGTARTKAFRTLLERARNSQFLLGEYEEMCGDPLESITKFEELAFWRDIYWEHARFYSAYRASNALLGQKQGAQNYHMHAEILLALGHSEVACQYARTSQAFGWEIGADDPCHGCLSSSSGESAVAGGR